MSKTLLKVTPRDFRLEKSKNVVQSASQALKTAALNCSGSNFKVPEESKIYDPCRQFFWTVGFASFAPRKVYWVRSVRKWRLFGSASCTAEVLRIYTDSFSGVFGIFVQNVCLNKVNFSFTNRTGYKITQHVSSATQVRKITFRSW